MPTQTQAAQQDAIFFVPGQYVRTHIGGLSGRLFELFRFRFTPHFLETSIENVTAGYLSQLVHYHVTLLRDDKKLPFEIGHLEAVSKVVAEIGGKPPEMVTGAVDLEKAVGGYRRAKGILEEKLGAAMPAIGLSGLAMGIGLAIAAVVYVMVLMAVDSAMPDAGPGTKRALGGGMFFGALILAVGIAWLLSLFMGSVPASCNTVSKLTVFFAAQRGADGAKGRDWNEDRVWRYVRAAIAAEWGLPVEKVTPQLVLVKLG